MNAVVFGLFLGALVTAVTADSGFISVYNDGGYVSTFYVSYKLNGKTVSEDSGNFTLGVTKTIKIPQGATDVFLKVSEYYFIESLTDVFSKTFSGPVKKCYKIWGTTLDPSYAEIGC